MTHVLMRRGIPFRPTVLALAIMSCTAPVQAFKIDTDNSDLKLRWDNTIKYTVSQRLEDQSPGLNTADDDNQDDGDQNFDKGLVSNRLDLLTEFDGSYRNFGFRFSGAAWYDDVYHQDTDNDSGTSNHIPANEFQDETKDIMGGDSELLDAFVYGRFDINDGTGTVRLGRHTILWGESLFFGANGIAGGMAPIDVVKLQSVPNTTFKEAARPIGKLSVDIPINEKVSIAAYIGYEWEKSQLPPPGAFLSSSDNLNGEYIITAPPLSPAPKFVNDGDIEPSDDGQYGLNVRWYDEDLDTDFGVYAIRYHSFGPSGNNLRLTFPGPTPAGYSFAYHEGIQALGASFATSVENWSLAGEISFRDNAPLASYNPTPSFGPAYSFDNDGNPNYAVGSTAHAQFSWIASLDPNVISDETSFVGEIAWNTRLGVDENEDKLNPYADKSATAVRMVFKPTYRQLFSGMDVSPSVGVGYAWGNSSAVGTTFGIDKGGDLNLGVDALYLNRWNASIKYVTYLGEEGGGLDATNTVQFKQALKDRDFITLSISTTF